MTELTQGSTEVVLNHGWPIPPAHFLRELRNLSEGLYPKETIEALRTDGYRPVIVGFEHGPEASSLPTFKDLFRYFKEHGSGQPKVALEIIPPAALRNIKLLHTTKQEYERLGNSLNEAQREAVALKIKELEEIMGINRLPTGDHRAMWLLENGFDVIPIEHEDVATWITEHGPLNNPPNPTREQIIRDITTGIHREIYGFQVLANERPDIIAVGYAHAFKYSLYLDPENRRSFYLFNFGPKGANWNGYLHLFREAYALFRREGPNV